MKDRFFGTTKNKLFGKAKDKQLNRFNMLDKKEHPMKFLYPAAAVIYDYLEKKGKTDIFGSHHNVREPGQKGDEAEYDRLCGYKTIAYILTVLIGTAFFAVICILAGSGVITGERAIKRAGTGSGTTSYELSLSSPEMSVESDIVVEISEQKCPEEKLDEYFESATEKLKAAVVGENASADEISGNVNLVKQIPGTSISVKFEDLDYTYIYSDGTIRFENIKEPVILMLTAELTYFDEVRIVSFPIRLVPEEKTEIERFMEKVGEELKLADEKNRTEEFFYLPEEIDGKEVGWKSKKNNSAGIVALLGIFTAIGVIPARNLEEKKLAGEREKEMMRDYPDIISKLSLLLTAGMTCRAAWEKICADYLSHIESTGNRSKGKKRRYAYEEMLQSLTQMNLGKSETEVYEEFGNKCRVTAYQRLGSMLSKNLRRGSRDMTALLQSEAQNAMEERREKVRQRGEEVGTKLLLPMFGMFGIVVAIVVVPAIRGMGL